MAGYSVTYTVVDNATKQIDAINRRIAQMRAPMERMSRQVSRFVDVSGLRKVATGFEWIGKAAGSVLRTLTAIVPVMGAITGAASIVGMFKLVQSYAAWSRELVQAADNIGTTTQKLQQFQDATRLAGGNASDMTDSLKGLHDRLADFNIGGGNAALTAQWANKLGINLRDANGQIRSAADLMPELIRTIGAIKDPADRAAAANALLGSSGEKLVETFRQSSQSFGQWFNDVQRYKNLTDEQKRSLQLFTEAQGRLGVGFDRLGQQISATLAKNLTPLLNKFAEFVEKNTPAILAAVDELSKRFAAWVEGIDWSKVTEGVNSVVDSLKWVVNNLDTIKTAAEVIAGLFVLKWGVDVVKAIGAVTTALGVTGGGAGTAGAIMGSGLLGALAGVAAIAGIMALGSAYETPENQAAIAARKKEQQKGTQAPSNMPTSDYYIDNQGRKHDATTGELIDTGPIQRQSAAGGYLPGGVTQAAYHPAGAATAIAGGSGTSEFWDSMARAVTKGFEDAWDHILGTGGAAMGGGGGGGGGGYTQAAYRVPGPIGGAPSAPAGGPPAGPAAPLSAGGGKSAFYDEQRKLIYDAAVKAGVPHPEVVAEVGASQAMLESGGGTRTPGGYNVYGIKSGGGVGGAGAPVSTQEEGPGGQRYTTQSSFATFQSKEDAATGYVEFLKRNPKHYAAVLQAQTVEQGIQAQGTSGYATDSAYLSKLQQLQRRYGGAGAPPATVPPQAPVNGSVDVSITHKNPPPNSAVTATGSGAVNVAPPRVEYQDMQSI
jgi:Mannosyl-glycoprotein endo-beta-N-acetylglucosaminidase